jgi:hypothetical protein
MTLPEEAAARKSGREVEAGRRALAAEVGEKVEAMAGRRGGRGMGAVVVCEFVWKERGRRPG